MELKLPDYKSFIVTASKKSKKSADAKKRSRFLSLVMPYMSSDSGKDLAEAIDTKNLEKFKNLWSDVTSKLTAKLEEEFKNDQGKSKRSDNVSSDGKSKEQSDFTKE